MAYSNNGNTRDHRYQSLATQAAFGASGAEGAVMGAITVRSGTLESRAQMMANRGSRGSRVQRRKSKAPLAVRSASATAQRANTLRQASTIAHTQPRAAAYAVASEMTHQGKQFQDLVEELTDNGCMDSGDWKVNIKRGGFHFKSGHYLNVLNALLSLSLTKSVRLGRISVRSKGKTSTGATAGLRDIILPKYDQTLIPDGVRYVRSDADRIVQEFDIYGEVDPGSEVTKSITTTGGPSANPQPRASITDGSSSPGGDSVRAQFLRDTNAQWPFGAKVVTGYVPLPVIDWRSGLKVTAAMFAAMRNNLWGVGLALFTETAGDLLGVQGSDFEQVRNFLSPNLSADAGV